MTCEVYSLSNNKLEKLRVPATFGTVEGMDSGCFLLILGGDGSFMWKSDRSLIGAFLPDLFSVRYQCF